VALEQLGHGAYLVAIEAQQAAVLFIEVVLRSGGEEGGGGEDR